MAEKRLIDANLAIDRLKTNIILGATEQAFLRNYVNCCPTVDAVEVVRCRDCKHWLKDVAGCTDFVGRCEWANYMVGAVGYCVYGERKDGDGNG